MLDAILRLHVTEYLPSYPIQLRFKRTDGKVVSSKQCSEPTDIYSVQHKDGT